MNPREPPPACDAGARPTKERPGAVRTPGFPETRPPPRENDRSPWPRDAAARFPASPGRAVEVPTDPGTGGRRAGGGTADARARAGGGGEAAAFRRHPRSAATRGDRRPPVAPFPRHRRPPAAALHHRPAVDRPVPPRQAGVAARQGTGGDHPGPLRHPADEPVPSEEPHVRREEAGMMSVEVGMSDHEVEGDERVERTPHPPEHRGRPPPPGVVRPPTPRLVADPRPSVRRDPDPPSVIVRFPSVVDVRPPGVPVFRGGDPLAVRPKLIAHFGRDPRLHTVPGPRRFLRHVLRRRRVEAADADLAPDGRLLSRPDGDRGTFRSGHGPGSRGHREPGGRAVRGQGIPAGRIRADVTVSRDGHADRGEVLRRKREFRLPAPKPVGNLLFAQLPEVHLGSAPQDEELTPAELDLRLGPLRDAHPGVLRQGEVADGLLPIPGIAGPDPGGSFIDLEARDGMGRDAFLGLPAFGGAGRKRQAGQDRRNYPNDSHPPFPVHRIPLPAVGDTFSLGFTTIRRPGAMGIFTFPGDRIRPVAVTPARDTILPNPGSRGGREEDARTGEERMKALLCTGFGPLEHLAIREIASPRPGPTRS